VHRIDPGGRGAVVWSPRLPGDTSSVSMSVDGQGNCAVTSANVVEIYDRNGKLLHSWKLPDDRPPSDVAFLPDGRLLFCLPHHNSLTVYSQNGEPAEVLTRFDGGRRQFVSPTGVAVSSSGRVLVVEEAGRSIVLRSLRGEQSVADSEFQAAFRDVPFRPDLNHCAFDGPDRILLPHRLHPAPLVYDSSGTRLLARDPARDLSRKGFSLAHGFAAVPDALFVLDPVQGNIYRVSRR